MAGFGGSIKLTGETEYKKALQNIKTGLKEVSTEMKLMTAQYQSNDRNVSALSAKSGELAKKLETQKKALDGLKASYAQMAAQYENNAKKNQELAQRYESEKSKLDTIGKTLGTTSKEYQEQQKVVEALGKELEQSTKEQEASERAMSQMRLQITQTETGIVKAENSLASLNEQLAEAEKEAEGAGDGIGTLGDEANGASDDLGQMGDEAGQAAEDIADSGEEADEAGTRFADFAKVAVGALEAIAAATTAVILGAAAVGKSMADLANDTGKMGDEIDKESQKLQLSAETYQKLDYALQRNGSNIDQVSKAIKTITNDLGDFQNGTEGAADKYEALGISLTNTDGSLKKTEDVLVDSLNALANMTDETKRNAMAQDLFGRSYAEMLPLLNAGGDSLKELMQEAEDYGMVMSDEAVKASAAYNDSLLKLQNTFTGVKNSIGAEFLPAITQIMDGMSDLLNGNENATDTIKAGAETIITKLKDMLPRILQFARSMSSTFMSIAPELLQNLAQGLLSGLPQLLPTVQTVIEKLLNIFSTLAPQAASAGIDLISNFAEGVGEMLPDVVNIITADLIPNLISAITTGAPKIVKAATVLLMGVVKSIPIIINNLLPELGNLISSVVNALVESAEILADAGLELFSVLSDEVLPTVIDTLIAELPTLITTITNLLLKSVGKLQAAGAKFFGGLIMAISKILPVLIKAVPALVTAIGNTLTRPDVMDELIKNAFDMFMAISQASAQFIVAFLPEVPKIVVAIGEALIAMSDYLAKMSLKLFLNILTALKDVGKKLLGEAATIVTNFTNNLITPLQNKFSSMRDTLKSTFNGFADWFRGVFSDAWAKVQGVFSNFGSFFAGLWGTIRGTFSSLGTNIASAISNSVKSGINGVITMIQNTINKGIGLINGAINLINKLPNVNVGKINTLSLPRLARGGIIDSPTIAEVGEQGREAIIPLENNTEWIKKVAAEISNAMVLPIQGIANTIANNPNSVMKYDDMVAGFKDALADMKVVLDDEQVGRFVEKTVADAIYT